jgi:hydrogenase/urease accessory protein HupE
MGRGLALIHRTWHALASRKVRDCRSSSCKRLAMWWLCACLPSVASAHGSVPGMNRFVTGILHPFTEPSHALLLVTGGLWLGQRALLRGQPALPVFAVALIAGLCVSAAGWELPIGHALSLVAAVLALITLWAPARPAHPAAMACLLGLGGVGVGLDSGFGSANGWPVAISLLGTAMGCFILLLNVAALSHAMQRRAITTLGVRILSSWLAACAVLMMALGFAGKGLA